MRLEGDSTLVLSRRNCQTLLNKVDDPLSSKTLIGGTDARGFTVKIESDSDHYYHEDRVVSTPGKVHEDHDPGIDFIGQAD